MKERKHRLKKKNVKRKRTISITKTKRSLSQLWAFETREGESFYYEKVNLVLNSHALQIILFGPIYVRTQYRFGSLQIVSLQKQFSHVFLVFLIFLYKKISGDSTPFTKKQRCLKTHSKSQFFERHFCRLSQCVSFFFSFFTQGPFDWNDGKVRE